MPDNNTTREFSYSLPITYKGVSYPSAPANILTDGQQTPGNVFADANGNYFVLGDNGTAKSVMPVHSLDEVVVTPSKENLLSSQFNEFLTQSNDQTQVLNTPHREYNPHLKNKAIKGALSHNLWEQEHPNLSAWSQALSAVPFAVASAPLIGAAGQSVMATTAGQTARAGISSLMSNPIVEAANTGLGLGFGVKGAYDVSQGEFTPETAMDLAGGAGLMFKSLTGLRKTKRPFVSELDWSTKGWFEKYRPNGYDTEDVAALKSHIPEYHKIEQKAKADGSWLKMPDGSTWKGDPRSWVQMQSRDYTKYVGNSPFAKKPFAHSTDASFDTFDLSHFGETDDGFYGKGFYSHPAEYINGEMRGRNTYGMNNYLLTTNVQRPLDLNNPDFKYAELLNRNTANVPKNISDTYDSVYFGILGSNMVGASPSELIVFKPNNYKSLLGNNGNFNALKPNLFKTLVPFGIPIGAVDYLENK